MKKKWVYTGWISGKDKPVRPGVYERKAPAGTLWSSLWDGERWRGSSISHDIARRSNQTSMYHDLPWRGRTEVSK